MSTIGGLLMPQFQPYDLGRTLTQATNIQGGMTQNQTRLLELAALKEQQAAEAQLMQAIQTNPALAQQLFGTIASLPTTGGPPAVPGAGPMTQQPFGPGGAGPTQTVPGGQDLSQLFQSLPGGVGPGQPQSTIASLAPQGQAPNPVLEMARTNPRAAMMLQQQMQQRQTQQWAIEEKRLDMGVKVSEAVARQLQGVTDQASLDEARERIRLIHPQAAAQVPQFYSKEAVEAIQQRGISVAELAKWRKDMASARQTDVMTQQLPATFKALEQFATGGTPPTPAGEAPPTPAAPTTGTQARTAPPEFESAITEANRLYPQVSTTRIKSIIAAESNFDPKAVSSAGAKGPMQLMPGTATEMGVDDPFDINQNVRGGTRYYAEMLQRYGGDERKALAAYNWGPGNLDKVNGDVSKAPAETQAYVNKVLGGGGAAPAGGTSTAQAPPTNPQLAQLDTRIKQGQALALQLSATPGMEQAATMVNQQVNDLQKERDRLDAPRQDFLKKQAVQGLELEQREREGLARAQLEADTKPASNTEIDAINRALPPDKQLSYGTTYKEIREKKLVGAAQVSDKVVNDLTTTTTAIQNFEELSNAVQQLPTGPLTQYVEQFKERWGIDISDERVAQRAILAGARNQLLQARSGAAVPEAEYQRLMSELPHEGNDPKVFKARLANTVRQFKNIYKTRVQILRKTGHAIPDDLMEPLPAPEGPPARPASTAVDKAREAMKPR